MTALQSAQADADAKAKAKADAKAQADAQAQRAKDAATELERASAEEAKAEADAKAGKLAEGQVSHTLKVKDGAKDNVQVLFRQGATTLAALTPGGTANVITPPVGGVLENGAVVSVDVKATGWPGGDLGTGSLYFNRDNEGHIKVSTQAGELPHGLHITEDSNGHFTLTWDGAPE